MPMQPIYVPTSFVGFSFSVLPRNPENLTASSPYAYIYKHTYTCAYKYTYTYTYTLSHIHI